MIERLPRIRRDGRCCVCSAEPQKVVTRDGRFCLSCLRKLIRRLSPGSVRVGPYGRRTREHKEDVCNNPSGSQENAIRAMEDNSV